jgi:hypothetical protein
MEWTFLEGMKFNRKAITLVSLLVGFIQGGCSAPKGSIFHEPPEGILQRVRLLTDLKGETNLREYENILGGRFDLVVDQRDATIPFQLYTLEGNAKKYKVELTIRASTSSTWAPKTVTLRILDIDLSTCIPLSQIERFAYTNFRVLPPSIMLGFAFTPLNSPYNPTVGISAPTGKCVGSIGIFYNTASSEPWGN